MTTKAPHAWSENRDRIARYCLYPDNRYLRRLLAGNVLVALILGCEKDAKDNTGIPRDLPQWMTGLRFCIESMQHPFPIEDFEGWEDDPDGALATGQEMMQQSMDFFFPQVREVHPYRLGAQWLPAIIDVCKAIQADALLWFLYTQGALAEGAEELDHVETMIETMRRLELQPDQVAEALSDAGMMATWFLAIQCELFASLVDQPPDVLKAVIDAAGIPQEEMQNYEQLEQDADPS